MKEKIKLSNDAYDILKKVLLILVPIATFITSISAALGWDEGSIIGAVLGALGALGGEVMQISSENYNRSLEIVEESEEEAGE